MDLDKGLTATDLDIRVQHFGTNKKEMPPRTPFWTFFIKALDDFMLKMLLVCACINIGFEVGFAKPKDRSHGKFYSLCTLHFLEKAILLIPLSFLLCKLDLLRSHIDLIVLSGTYFSMDRRFFNLLGSLHCCVCWFLQRLQEGRSILQALCP